MNTTIISFRIHKNLREWLVLAGKGFNSEGELPRLIITKVAIEQSSDIGMVKAVKGLLRRERAISIGNTTVCAVRLPAEMAELARECATRRGKTTSEWCADALDAWYREFYQAYEGLDGQVNFPKYAINYRALVEGRLNVYAQKGDKQEVVA